jgi:hypothetical protein
MSSFRKTMLSTPGMQPLRVERNCGRAAKRARTCSAVFPSALAMLSRQWGCLSAPRPQVQIRGGGCSRIFSEEYYPGIHLRG